MISADRAPRVLMVDPNANTLPYDHALCEALAANGCQVVLATSPFLYDEPPPANGFSVVRPFFSATDGLLGRLLGVERRAGLRRALKGLEYPIDWARLLIGVRRWRPDVVHVQWSIRPELDVYLWLALKRTGARVVYTAHNLLPHRPSARDPGRFRRIYHAVDGVVVHTERSAQALVQRFGVPLDRVAVAPHGPLLGEEDEIGRAAARVRLGLPAKRPIVLFAGLIEPYKGLADLVEAFAAVATAHPTAWLVVAGRPNEPFAPYAERLAGLELIPRTRFDLRFLPGSVLAAYLQAADVVALPYREVTSSGMLMAARRFAAPVVASSTGDLAELVEDARTGLTYPPGDAAALGGALHRLLSDPGFAVRLGENGRRHANAVASWQVAAERTRDLYRRGTRLNSSSPGGAPTMGA